MTKYITIRMTVEEALRQGLIICTCGHPTNNHFNFTNSCARCDCLKYRPVARVGKLVECPSKCRTTRAAPVNTSSRSTGCSSEQTTGRSRTSAKTPSSPTTSKVTRARTSRPHNWKFIGRPDYTRYECQRCRLHTSNIKDTHKNVPCEPGKSYRSQVTPRVPCKPRKKA
jgi:hypothetical protein